MARERESICESLRVLFTPHVPLAKGTCRPRVTIGGVGHVLGRMRSLSRIAKAAARAETASLCVLVATCEWSTKYTLTGADGAPRQTRADKGRGWYGSPLSKVAQKASDVVPFAAPRPRCAGYEGAGS